MASDSQTPELPGDGAATRSRVAPPLTLQQLIAAAERLRRADRHRRDEVDWLTLVEDAYDRLCQSPFPGLPLHGFRLPDDPKQRLLAAPARVERVIEAALQPILERAVEARLAPAVHGYRRGRSTFTAALAAASLLAQGHREVLLCDVEDFFPSVDWRHLEVALRAILPERLGELVMAFVRAPIDIDGSLERRERGLPLGRPLSPALANVFLEGVDAAALAAGAGYLRYADDLFLAGRTVEELEAIRAAVVGALQPLGLRLKEAKSRRITYDGRAFDYLGHKVDADGVLERVQGSRLARIGSRGNGEAGPTALATLNRRCQTLYVTQPGVYLRVEDGLLVIQRGKEVVREVSPERIDRVVVLAGVALSSAFVTRCLEKDIPILFLLGKGRTFGTLTSSTVRNPLRLRAQYDLHTDAPRRLALARSVIARKVEALASKVRRRASPGGVLETLLGLRSRVAEAESIEALVGLEGMATKAYYEAFAGWVKDPAFAFRGRSRRPPKDAINSLLSFAYALVFGEIHTGLLAHGLDPFPGVLHALHRNHPALASDLMEPYRPIVADPFVLLLVNSRQVAAEDFETRPSGAVYMRRETSRTVLAAWERYVTRPLGGSVATATPRALLDGAVRALLAVVMGERATLDLPLAAADLEALPSREELAPETAPSPEADRETPPTAQPPSSAPASVPAGGQAPEYEHAASPLGDRV